VQGSVHHLSKHELSYDLVYLFIIYLSGLYLRTLSQIVVFVVYVDEVRLRL
jgi:hypothetical protein